MVSRTADAENPAAAAAAAAAEDGPVAVLGIAHLEDTRAAGKYAHDALAVPAAD